MLGSPSPASALVVLGPTACGKTAVAVEVARRLHGEVISADSRAFFRGLDIVADKPSIEERKGVPHHLIDCVPIDEAYDAMAFRADVVRLLAEIRDRHRVPILTGGGTLYLGAIVHGVFEGPSKDLPLRRALADREADDLYQELLQKDPAAARTIHPHDRLRITRALEVLHLSGVPISQWQRQARPVPGAFHLVGLTRERSEHRAVIAERVHRMVRSGVIQEVAGLIEKGLDHQAQAYRTIGVPEAVAVLEGRLSLDAFIEQVTHRTWQLARRQSAWFRRDQNIHWIKTTGRPLHEIADEIVQRWPEQEMPR